MGILAGLFDVAQDLFLSQSEWYGVSNQQSSPDESVDMTHASGHFRDITNPTIWNFHIQPVQRDLPNKLTACR